MKGFKKILRLLGFVLLIVLASVGIGFAGGIPVPRSNRKEDTIETVDSKEGKIKLVQGDIKQ